MGLRYRMCPSTLWVLETMIHCLHGAVGSFKAWENFREDLGHSMTPVDLWRFFDQATPTLAEAGQSICQTASSGDILLGYSMGGRLALHALITDPQKWKAAIIVSAHPGLTEEKEERRIKDLEWAALSARDWESFLQEWNQQSILDSLPEGLHQADISDQKNVSQSFENWSLGNQKDLRPELPKITCPVLWITGEHDPKFTTLAKEACELLPNSEHLVIANSGHRAPWDQPSKFRAVINDFLKR